VSAEIDLDGLDPSTCESEILYIPKRSAVFGPAKIFDKCLIDLSNYALQLEAHDPIRLRPAFRSERAHVNVVVVVGAGKGEAVGKQALDRAPFLLLPP
jgi:hypothetical protein